MANRSQPSRLTLILTTRCNMNCSYCYQRVREPRSMEWLVAKAAAGFAMNGAGGERSSRSTGANRCSNST